MSLQNAFFCNLKRNVQIPSSSALDVDLRRQRITDPTTNAAPLAHCHRRVGVKSVPRSHWARMKTQVVGSESQALNNLNLPWQSMIQSALQVHIVMPGLEKSCAMAERRRDPAALSALAAFCSSDPHMQCRRVRACVSVAFLFLLSRFGRWKRSDQNCKI